VPRVSGGKRKLAFEKAIKEKLNKPKNVPGLKG
jgi:hypothetical protein